MCFYCACLPKAMNEVVKEHLGEEYVSKVLLHIETLSFNVYFYLHSDHLIKMKLFSAILLGTAAAKEKEATTCDLSELFDGTDSIYKVECDNKVCARGQFTDFDI